MYIKISENYGLTYQFDYKEKDKIVALLGLMIENVPAETDLRIEIARVIDNEVCDKPMPEEFEEF